MTDEARRSPRERHRERQRAAAVGHILSSADAAVRTTGLVEPSDGVIDPQSLWARVARVDARPTGTIAADALDAELLAWVAETMRHLRLDPDCFVSFGGLGLSPWARVVPRRGPASLAELWLSLPQREMLVLASDQAAYGAITEEEDAYHAFIGPLTGAPAADD